MFPQHELDARFLLDCVYQLAKVQQGLSFG